MREFVALLGGAAVGWPLTARGQPPAIPVVGFLEPTSPDTFPHRLLGFRQGLKESGYVEGENVAIAYRFAENQLDRLPVLAADLVPATYPLRQFAEVGGLMSYGSDLTDAWRQVGVYTGRILKGLSRRTYQLRRRVSSSWSLTPRRLGHLVSLSRRPCSPVPTR
jgi:hypothetical protein